MARTNPNHKFDRISVHIFSRCQCGWRGTIHAYGRGSRAGAYQEWRDHVAECENEELLADANSHYSKVQLDEIAGR